MTDEWEGLKARCEACTVCENLSKEGRLWEFWEGPDTCRQDPEE